MLMQRSEVLKSLDNVKQSMLYDLTFEKRHYEIVEKVRNRLTEKNSTDKINIPMVILILTKELLIAERLNPGGKDANESTVKEG